MPLTLPPIFTFEPKPDVEVFETWISPTSVQRSYSGNEMRQCLSWGFPFMEYEFDVRTVTYRETWAIEAFIRENLGKPVMLPLSWWGMAITIERPIASTVLPMEPDGWAIPFAPFFELNNPYCYIAGDGKAEAQRVWFVSGGSVQLLGAGTANAYPVGSHVMPLNRVLMQTALVRERASSEVFEARFKFVDAKLPEDAL